VEANAWHSLWMCDHDLEGLELLLGGRAGFLAKLSTFFEEGRKEWDKAKKDELAAGLPRPHYWHGNEPDIHAPYLFARAGRPDLTQKWVRWIEREFYGPRPDGLAGNDDGGTLASWFVWSALGIYPLPGSDLFVLGAPLFPRARITVPGGFFTIEAPEVSEENLYVQAVTLDGEPVAGPMLRQRQLRPGSTLRFTMGPSPGTWARY
jgi:putative alpha-1,2-mannosidase